MSRIITIGREFGSGGREIGRNVERNIINSILIKFEGRKKTMIGASIQPIKI